MYKCVIDHKKCVCVINFNMQDEFCCITEWNWSESHRWRHTHTHTHSDNRRLQ